MRIIERSWTLLAVAGFVSGCLIRIDGDGNLTERVTQSEPLPEDLSDLSLSVPAGDVSIRTGSTVGVEATLRFREGDDPPRIIANETGTIVDHTWECDRARRCSIDLDVTVPEGMERISLDLEAGDVSLSDVDGGLVVDLEAGDVTVDRHAGDVDIAVSAGSIVLHSLDADDVYATVEAGSVDLELDGRPVQVEARTATGNVDILVPSGAYALDLSTAVGSVDVGNGITADSGADASITARAEVGSVSVDGS